MNLRPKGTVTIPRTPKRGLSLLPWCVDVNRCLQQLRDRIITAPKGGRRGGGSKPLKLTIKQGTAADKFQIIPGYVNFEMPTLATVALDNATPPEITVTADVWVWIKCVGTFVGVGADTYVVTIETTATEDAPADPSISGTGFTSYRCIGTVDFTSGTPDTFAITNYHNGGNLSVESFGNINLWWLA
jgi:hypothetical protein